MEIIISILRCADFLYWHPSIVLIISAAVLTVSLAVYVGGKING